MRKARMIVPVSFAMLMFGVWGGTQLTALASARQATNASATRASSSGGKLVTSSLKGASATYFESEISSDTALTGGATPLGKALSVKCSGPAKCTLELDEDLQYCGGDSGDNYLVLASVDGRSTTGPIGGTFAGEECDTTHWAWQVKNLASGAHSVQFYGFDGDGTAVVENFMFTVRVFNQ